MQNGGYVLGSSGRSAGAVTSWMVSNSLTSPQSILWSEAAVAGDVFQLTP